MSRLLRVLIGVISALVRSTQRRRFKTAGLMRRRIGSSSRFAVVVSLLVGVSAFAAHRASAHASTTAASTATFIYDAPAVARAHVHEFRAAEFSLSPFDAPDGSAAPSAPAQGISTTLNPRSVATNTGSALADASSAAFRAADDPASICIKNKHLASAAGNHAKFASESISEVQGWVAQGLRSDGVQFLPNHP